MSLSNPARALVVGMILATAAGAQDGPLLRGATIIPARSAPPPDYVSAEAFPGGIQFNMLSSGRLVIVHHAARRVVLLEPDLRQMSVLMDATKPAPLTYPPTIPRLARGPADSSYYFDRVARVFRVIGPDGTVARTQPIVDSANFATLTTIGGVFDGRGRVLVLVPQEKRAATGLPKPMRDTVFVVRIDPGRAGRDTVGALYHRQQENHDSLVGTERVMARRAPLFEMGDAFTMTSTGQAVAVSALDNSIRWMGPDGRWRNTAPIPFPLNPILASDKPRVLEEGRAYAARMSAGDPNRPPPPGAIRLVVQVDDSIPDRMPVFQPMAAIPDSSGGFWLRTGVFSLGRFQGLPTYMHVDAKGVPIDQVTIPGGRYLVGESRGGLLLVATTPQGFRFEHVMLPHRER